MTNNRRDFEQWVVARIAESSKKDDGCTQVQGLVVVVPSDAISQARALATASKNLLFEGKRIGWKTVYELCLKVVIQTPAYQNHAAAALPALPVCGCKGVLAMGGGGNGTISGIAIQGVTPVDENCSGCRPQGFCPSGGIPGDFAGYPPHKSGRWRVGG